MRKKEILNNYAEDIYHKLNTKFPRLGISIKRFIKYKILFNNAQKKVKGKNNSIIYNNVILNKVIFDIKGDNNTITIGKGTVLNGMLFYIRGNNHIIEIGQNCMFEKGGTIWMDHSNGFLKVGNYSTIGGTHIAVTEANSSVIIGEDCMFASGVEIRTGDSHSILDINTHTRINFAQNVIIGNHVWLASRCCILKGVVIGDNSIVALGAIVTKKHNLKNIILAGNPAKVVKKNVTWEREIIL